MTFAGMGINFTARLRADVMALLLIGLQCDDAKSLSGADLKSDVIEFRSGII